jgi:hypothetical protein
MLKYNQQCDALESRAFRTIKPEGRALINEIIALIKEAPESCLILSTM